MANHYSTKHGDHRHCGSGEIMVLVSHVISQDLVIEGSSDFMGENTSRKSSLFQVW